MTLALSDFPFFRDKVKVVLDSRCNEAHKHSPVVVDSIEALPVPDHCPGSRIKETFTGLLPKPLLTVGWLSQIVLGRSRRHAVNNDYLLLAIVGKVTCQWQRQ